MRHMKLKNDYNTFSMSVPIIFQSFFQILFGLADTWFLSLYSDLAVACVGYANQILAVLLLVYVILSSSISIVGAQYLGDGRKKEAGQLCSDAVTGTVLVSILMSAVLMAGSPFLLELLQVPDPMREGTWTYFMVISAGLVFQGGNTVFVSVYRIFAKAKAAMLIGILTNVCNIILDAAVILNPFQFAYDPVFGIAAATVSSNLVGFLILYFLSRRQLGITYHLSMSVKNIKLLLQYGVPAAGENISYKISQLVVTVLLTALGSSVLTAKIYAMNLMLFVSMIPNSIGIATGIIIAYLFGEKKYDDLYRKCWQNIGAGILFVLFLNIAVILMSDWLLHFFTGDGEIIRNAKWIIYLEAFTLLFKVGNFMFGNSLKGVGDVYYCVAVSILSMWIWGVGLAYVLGILLDLGIVGIYSTFCADEMFRSILLGRRWTQKRFLPPIGKASPEVWTEKSC